MYAHDEVETSWRVPAQMRLGLLALLSADPAQAETITYDEFLEWADEDTLAEWVEGRVVMTSPAGKRHQDLVRFLADLLAAYADTHGLGTVLLAPFQMHLPASGREPSSVRQRRPQGGRLPDAPAGLRA